MVRKGWLELFLLQSPRASDMSFAFMIHRALPTEWYQTYVDALMIALPHELMKAYSFQDNPEAGCLDASEEEDFEVIVNLQEVPTRNDTHIANCQFQYPATPFPWWNVATTMHLSLVVFSWKSIEKP